MPRSPASPRFRGHFLLLMGLPASACIDKLLEGDVPPDARLSVSLATPSITLKQGEETTVPATVTRTGDYSGAVNLSVTDVPPGVTVSIEGQSVQGTVTSGTIRLRVGTAAPLGISLIRVRGKANGLPDGVTQLRLEITQASSFALSLSTTALTVIHGGRAPLTVSLVRTALSAPVSLSITGPAGVTGTFAANPATGTTSLLTVSVALAVAPGTHTVRIRASTAGLPDQEAVLTLTVTADPIQLIMPAQQAAAQGSQLSGGIILNRSTYQGAVTLSVDNPPAGMAASFQPEPATGDSSHLVLAIGLQVAPGTYDLVVRGRGAGIPDATTSFSLSVTAASISLGLGPQSLSLLPGTSGTVQLFLTRTDFSGPVDIVVEGAPPGLGVTLNPAGQGNFGTLTVSAAGSLAPGQYPITVRAVPVLPAGIARQALRQDGDPARLAESSVLLQVTVHPTPSGSGNVTLDWSGCAPPAWVAYQDGDGPWIQVLSSSGSFRFSVTAGRGGYAYLAGNDLIVHYATQAELTAQPVVFCQPSLPVKTVTGVARHYFSNDSPFGWHLGGGVGFSTVSNPFIGIVGVRPGVHDLIGWGTTSAQVRVLLRRDLDLPDGADLGVPDLLGTESVGAVRPTLSVIGRGTDLVFHTISFLTTAACDVAPLYATAALASSTAIMSGVPPNVLRVDDYHLLTVTAVGAETRVRSRVFQAMGVTTTAELPPVLPDLTVSSLPGTFKRLQATVSSLPEVYGGGLTLSYLSGARTAKVSASIAYAGAPSAVLAMPDLSGVSGWPIAGSIAPGDTGTWSFAAESFTTGSLCTDGRTSASTTRVGTF